MPETITAGSDGVKKWMWYNIMSDLEVQGDLPGVVIYPLYTGPHSCSGILGNNRLFISWFHNQGLVVSMHEYSQPLVDAFSAVVGYEPFCRYETPGDITTVEWDKIDPEERFSQMAAKPHFFYRNLVRLEPKPKTEPGEKDETSS